MIPVLVRKDILLSDRDRLIRFFLESLMKGESFLMKPLELLSSKEEKLLQSRNLKMSGLILSVLMIFYQSLKNRSDHYRSSLKRPRNILTIKLITTLLIQELSMRVPRLNMKRQRNSYLRLILTLRMLIHFYQTLSLKVRDLTVRLMLSQSRLTDSLIMKNITVTELQLLIKIKLQSRPM